MIEAPSIIFRADGNNSMGLGHLVRTAALAAMLKDSFSCKLITKCRIAEVINDLAGSFSRLIEMPDMDLSQEVGFLETFADKKDIIVLDGYHFNEAYQQMLTDRGYELFSIDDIHAFRFLSKVVINHSGGLQPTDYKALPSTQFFLGPHYALLRQPFLRAARTRRTSINDRNCFICFGGADPANKTLELLQSDIITRGGFDKIHVVTGSAYAFRDQLEAYAADHENIILHHALPPEEMVNVMQQCSFAICSPSGILYEYLSIGGIVFLEQIAANQKDVIRYFTNAGMAFPLEQLGKLSGDEMQQSIRTGASYFDGRSGERCLKIFRQYVDSRKLNVRRAQPSDLAITFTWANDPDVRNQSYNQDTIAFEQHKDWFQKKLNDTGSAYYILESDGLPVAQIRFQVNHDEAVLGYLAGSTIRSKGLGTAILGKGIEAFIKDHPAPVQISGYVKRSNIASQRSFEKLAFQKQDTDVYPDSFKYTMNYGIQTG